MNESTEDDRELIEMNEKGEYISSQYQEEVKKEKRYIKIPVHYIIYLPISFVIICLIFFTSTVFSHRKKSIKFIKARTLEDFRKIAGDIILSLIKENMWARISLDTGSAPKQIYKYLIDKYLDNIKGKESLISFRHIRIFNMKEMWGVPEYSEESYAFFLKKNFIDQVDIKPKNVFLINSFGDDPQKTAELYNNLLKEKPIDLQIINLNGDGSFGFLNGGENKNRGVMVKNFNRKRKREIASEKFFDNIDKVPDKGITQGLGNLMESKNILILAKGKESAQGLKYLMKNNKYNKDFPITAMCDYKGKIFVVADEDACSLL